VHLSLPWRLRRGYQVTYRREDDHIFFVSFLHVRHGERVRNGLIQQTAQRRQRLYMLNDATPVEFSRKVQCCIATKSVTLELIRREAVLVRPADQRQFVTLGSPKVTLLSEIGWLDRIRFNLKVVPEVKPRTSPFLCWVPHLQNGCWWVVSAWL